MTGNERRLIEVADAVRLAYLQCVLRMEQRGLAAATVSNPKRRR